MSHGGPRPDAGRRSTRNFVIHGEKYPSCKKAAQQNGVCPSTILNWCKDPKKPDCFFEAKRPALKKADVGRQAVRAGITPLEFLLNIMRDESELPECRDRAANWALPYLHTKPLQEN